MPLRSPKMYFCILGFQRLVWWPKCTPASSSSFMVNAAITSSFGSPPRRSAGLPLRAPPSMARGVCDGVLRRVLRVEPHVLLAEIAGPDAVLAAPDPQVDGDVVFRLSHDLAQTLQLDVVLQHPTLDHALVAERDRDLVLLDAGGRFTERHHDPAPVGIGADDRGLDQRRVRDTAGREQGVTPAGR